MDLSAYFKDLVWDHLVRAGITQLFKLVPFLGWGPIGVIVGWLALQITDQLFAVLVLSIALEEITLRNEAHRKAYDDASVILRIIAHEKGVDSDEFKKAREKQVAALAVFVHFA